MQSEPMVMQFKAADMRSRSQKGRTCRKCGKVHDGACRSFLDTKNVAGRATLRGTAVSSLIYPALGFSITVTRWAM